MNAKTFANRYDAIMKLTGTRAVDLSKATGITQKTLSEWKRGKIMPHKASIKLVADYLNVPTEVFTEDHCIIEI